MLYPTSREQVTEIYVATFMRAPDTAGLLYWSNHAGLNIEQIAESFFHQPETESKYPDSMSPTEFVTTIYNNVFNRDPDPAGLEYWVDGLTNGSITRSGMIIAVVNGAQGQDQRILDNKTEVGLYFAQNAASATLEQAYEVMAGVTSEGSSVEAALAEIDILADHHTIPPAPIMDLTIHIDTIEGSDIDSTINGLVDTDDTSKNTLNDEDMIDGGGGSDTLILKVSGGAGTTSAIAHMENVETLTIESSATADQAFDLAGTTGITDIKTSGVGTAGLTFSNVATIVNLELGVSAAISTTVTYSAATGTTDTMDVKITTAAAQTLKVEGIETLNVETGSGVQELNISDAALESVVVTGAGDLTLSAVSAADSALTVDGSAATGNLTIGSTIIDTAGATVSGGSGNDTIVASSTASGKTLTVSGNGGDDTISVAAGVAGSISQVTGGAGVDEMTAGAGTDTFNFANSGDTGITEATADKIISFATGTDKINFATLAAGVATNFDGATVAVADFAAAKTAADGILDGTIIYSYQFDGTNGYLFVDNDADGTADEAIVISALAAGGVDFGDILA